MKNLRGSVLTVLTAIVVASLSNQVTAQLPPPGPAGSMPLPSQVAMPAATNAPVGFGAPQGVLMPPPQAMAQFANAATANQVPLAVAQIPAPQPMYNMPMAAGYGPVGYGPVGYGPAAYGPAAYGPDMALQPNWGVQPASYGTPQPFPSMDGMTIPAGYEMGGGEYGGGGCAACGGYGCEACSGYEAPGLGARFLSRLLPYGEGGQCAPRWYDITMDGMYLSREKASRTIDFASDGINGDILLSTNDLNFDQELGFRFTGAHQIFAGATLEFTYFGLLDWSTSAVNRPPQFEDDIFSVLSDFGNINTPFGFDETDRSRQQSLAYSSSVDNFELNVRKRFTAPNCRLQYSWLAGVRYLYLLEDFTYFTLGGDADLVTPGLQSRGSMNYGIDARNSLTGFQIGGDAWLNLVPGVNVGADIKAGVYGNYVNQSTNILATTTSPASATTFVETLNSYDISMIADANMYFMWRLGPHWTVRAGYNFMFMDGVALAPENFNTVAPNIFTGGVPTATRVPTLNDNGNVFYHGGFGGIEFMW
ncbi:MAG: BBP7 family outer membrane beta-barrel protein [Planctomycetota bacterium]|nr:BBP7 family outer membrane beta-barrel protein [Planctomycetota bacterium]